MRAGYAPSEALAEELRQHVSKHMGPIARPEEVRFVDKLPKTRSGKIMRRMLKARRACPKATSARWKNRLRTVDGARPTMAPPTGRRRAFRANHESSGVNPTTFRLGQPRWNATRHIWRPMARMTSDTYIPDINHY